MSIARDIARDVARDIARDVAGRGGEVPISLGAIAWFDPHDFGVDLVSGDIASITDRIGGHVISQATPSKRPAHVAAHNNGVPAAQFAAASSEFLHNGTLLAGALSGSDWTVYIVCEWTAGGSNPTPWGFGQDSVLQGYRLLATSGATLLRARDDAGTTDASQGVRPTGPVWHYSYRDVGTEIAVVSSYSSKVTAADRAAAGEDSFGVGGRYDDSQYLNGYVQDLVVWDRLLTTAEHAAVQSWLESRYGGF